MATPIKKEEKLTFEEKVYALIAAAGLFTMLGGAGNIDAIDFAYQEKEPVELEEMANTLKQERKKATNTLLLGAALFTGGVAGFNFENRRQKSR